MIFAKLETKQKPKWEKSTFVVLGPVRLINVRIKKPQARLEPFLPLPFDLSEQI